METYKIRVQVEIVPCTESPTGVPVPQEDGSVALILAENEASNIDACEQALLQTVYPTLRDTLSRHLSAVSKKKPMSMGLREWS